MRFFRLKVETDKKFFPEEDKKKRNKQHDRMDFNDRVKEYADQVKNVDAAIAEKSYGRDVFINFSGVDKFKGVLIMATERDNENMQEIRTRFSEYLSMQEYDGKEVNCEEITTKKYRDLLSQASRSDFIRSYDETISQYGLFKHTGSYRCIDFDEYLLHGEVIKREDALRQVSEMQTIPSLEDEISRICATSRRRWMPGNPVHYVLSADEGKYRDEYFMLLIRTLYSCKRINCKRFTQIDYKSICDDYSQAELNEIYELQTGGAVIINVLKDTVQDSAYLRGGKSRVEEVCKMAMKWKNKVLTVFFFPRDSESLQKVFFSEMDCMSLVKLEEAVVFDKEAKAFLKKLAFENSLRTTPGLNSNVEKGVGYTKNDLEKIFDRWFGIYIKERIFPQYSTAAISMNAAENKAAGAGIERLDELIGLSETKALVSDILDFAKSQKMYSFGEKRTKQSLHMIFSGNPGTAKTTVARLVAQILKENEILETGDLFEVGRGDLVDQYLGGTAPRIQRAFKRARGSVLFIDEAYSLVDHDDGLYGDEAISTIVQEMENYRDEIVVIFAGYPDKMEKFLNKNPGLRSRIGFHVNFPDYNADELYEILELLAKDTRMKLAPDVRERVYPFITKAAAVKEFGNGRYARNLLEKARMRQAKRLMRMDSADVIQQVATTLIADDFEEICLTVLPAEKRVGFN